jgi:Lrp/AsnC family leucine-responsive transcriptional regulator
MGAAGQCDAQNGIQMRKLDMIDRQLLEALQDDDRASLSELGKAVGAPASTVNDRIKRLHREGLISGFHARLSPEALGLDLLAFMLISWTNPKVEAGFLKRVKASPAVLECHHVTGPANYLLKIRVASTRELEAFLSDIVKAVEGLERSETMIVLSSPKETWKINLPAD